MFTVKMSNSGGVLDARRVGTSEEAATVAIAMIEEAGELFDGDSISIHDDQAS